MADTRLAEAQALWMLPVTAHFFDTFFDVFGTDTKAASWKQLPQVTIEDLESWLTEGTPGVVHTKLLDLIMRLLRALEGRSDIT